MPTKTEIAFNRAAWLSALRGGEYSQDTGVLRSLNGYCCLGVMCDLVDSADWTLAEAADWIPGDPRTFHYKGKDLLPSPEVLRLFGLDTPDASSLAEMNDNGMSFAEIAQYLESQWAVG